MEKEFNTGPMKPKHVDVQLEDGITATVSLFDLEIMVKSLITDEQLMDNKNLAPGYDIYTGMETESSDNAKYGEIHTGDAWDPARIHFCGPDGKFMPISLVIFGDKTYTDLHGSLAVTPLLCSIRQQETSQSFGDYWHISLIYPTARARQMSRILYATYGMNTYILWQHLR